MTCPISHSVQLTCAEFPVKLWRTQNVSSSSTLVSKLTPQTFFPEKKNKSLPIQGQKISESRRLIELFVMLRVCFTQSRQNLQG